MYVNKVKQNEVRRKPGNDVEVLSTLRRHFLLMLLLHSCSKLVMGQSAWSPLNVVSSIGNFMFRLLDDNTKEVQCASCFEAEHRLFKVPCGHAFCRECVRGMFVAALNDSTLKPVKCCGRRVDQRLRRAVLNLEECDRFETSLEESEATNKMFWYVSKHNISFHIRSYVTHNTLFLDHSPRPDCSTFHNLDKTAQSGTGRFLCSNCNLPLCANCRSTHDNMTCAAYQSLPEQDRSMNDILFLNAAKKARYAQCPWCSRFI